MVRGWGAPIPLFAQGLERRGGFNIVYRLVAGGNKYEVLAVKLSDAVVVIAIRKTKRSPEQARIASFPSYLQKQIGDFDIDDPMGINDEIRMEDDMDEIAPQPVENEAMKSFMRGDFGESADDASLKF